MWDKEQSPELETRLAESGQATFPVSPSGSATGSGPELCFLNGVRGGPLAGRGLSRLLGVQDGLSKHFNAVCCCLWMTHYPHHHSQPVWAAETSDSAPRFSCRTAKRTTIVKYHGPQRLTGAMSWWSFREVISAAKEVMFSRVSVYLFVCLSVNSVTQK